MKNDHTLRGVFAAILTPLRADGRIDVGRLINHCRWVMQQGCHGVSLFGTTGEGNSLTVSERRDALTKIVAAGVEAARMIPAVGCCASDDTIELITQSVRLGCKAVLVAPPFYYKDVGEEGIVSSYGDAISRIGDDRLRIYLYNIPQMTGVVITESIIARLLERYPETIRGLKDSSGDPDYARSVLKSFPGLELFTGNERRMAEILRHGGAGTIGGIANIWPASLRDLYDNWDKPEANGIADKIGRVTAAVDSFAGIAALKHVLGHYQNDRVWPRVRPPLESLTGEQGRRLIAEIEAAGYTSPVARGAA